ncbi:Chaperone DnaJ-domain superfamily protein [Striga hermonthica]|uniref:Chaperone DnaJ-domain superfamily protein n=1 Tax=Striga hermonthica TaxID=68872 RepID=A0A9N7MSW5_STRHE|nr:Chaperone DnaJ-domain superfamily protein [Striga hermonthica]
MEHSFFPTPTTRAEALRWLSIAEKLLSARDLLGSKSFAGRARDSDPSLTPADQILAVAETLLAGDRRIGNNQHDWYAILRVPPQQGRDTNLIANQYRSLALLLNPQKNRFPYAEQAFRLVLDAWSVLSNPSRKSVYDRELAFYLQSQPQQQQPQPDPFSNPVPATHQSFMFFGGSSSSGLAPAPASQPQPAGVNFSQAQVHATPQPKLEQVGARSVRKPQNFMSFDSGTNLDFGSGSGSKSIPEPANKHVSENYSTFSGNAAAATEATQGQVNSNNHNNQQQQNYTNVGDKTSDSANVSENVGDKAENQEDGERVDEEEDRVDSPEIGDGSTMWTACPYCFHMYEYPTIYADCTLRCQNCKKAFQAVVIPSPPPVLDGREEYFCCWGFLPMGFSMDNWEKNRGSASTWTPFSPMFTCPQPFSGSNNAAVKKTVRKNSAPRVYIDDEDDVYVDVSDSSESDDADWQKDTEKRRKKAKNNVKGKGVSGGTPSKSAKKAQTDKGKTVNVQDGLASQNVDETPNKVVPELSKKGAAVNGRKQPGRVVRNFGKLDLNVEFSNEPEESAPKVDRENGSGCGEDENIEGIGFFEGLDEFLSSLPILNVVGDDKFLGIAERLKKPFAAHNGPSSSGSKREEPPRSAAALHSEFNQRASRIGFGIHQTSQKLATLAKSCARDAGIPA